MSSPRVRGRFWLRPRRASTSVEGIVFQTIGEQSYELDLYKPEGIARPPVVVFVNVGSLDAKRWGQYTSWGRLAAGAGIAGVTYDALEGTNLENLAGLIDYVRAHAAELGVDGTRIAIWACSANVKVGLPFALDAENDLAAAVFYYGIMSSDDPVRRGLPMYVARAGLDAPGINRLIDDFVERAIRSDAELELVNYPTGQHAFDVRDDTERSRQIIRDTLAFLAFHLDESTPRDMPPMTASRLYYLMLEDEAAALAELNRLHETDPDNQIFSDMAMDQFTGLLISDDKSAAAAQIAQLHAKAHPDSPRAEFNLARMAHAAGDLEQAERRAHRTLELIEREGVHFMVKRNLDAAANEMLNEIRDRD